MTQTPAFDLIQCVGKAYQVVWAERRYLLRLAAIPFLLKVIFFTLGYTQGGDNNLVRLSLILVPAWLVEGWMLAHFVRLILLGQRWPFQPSGDRQVDLPLLQTRYRGIMAGLVTFTLIQLFTGGWFALLMTLVPVSFDKPPSETEVAPQAAMLACLLLGVAVYCFRFMWLYIPVAVGAPLKAVAARLAGGFGLSIRMIGLWLLCAVPVMIVMQVLVGLVLMLAGPENAGHVVTVLSVMAKVVLDLVKNLLCAAAMVYAYQEIFGKTAQA